MELAPHKYRYELRALVTQTRSNHFFSTAPMYWIPISSIETILFDVFTFPLSHFRLIERLQRDVGTSNTPALMEILVESYFYDP